MVIGDFHARFDPLVYRDFMMNVGKGNVRRTLEQFMNNYNCTCSKDIEGINLELLNLEIVTLQNQKTKLEVELQSKAAMKDKIAERIQKDQEAKLKKEKEIQEAKTRCINCGNSFENEANFTKVPAGQVCKACFMAADGTKWKQWNRKDGEQLHN